MNDQGTEEGCVRRNSHLHWPAVSPVVIRPTLYPRTVEQFSGFHHDMYGLLIIMNEIGLVELQRL